MIKNPVIRPHMIHRIVHFAVLAVIVHLIASCHSIPEKNHLAGERSPYLQMHARNPVDWYPWSPQAFEKAQKENKLLLISCGYSACHWCHVMEEGAFSDTAVARFLNRHYISIKVDREERPDIDALYMQSCLIAGGGSCGWPLNTFALPDGRPVYSGTYYPAKNFLDVLRYFVKEYDNNPGKMTSYAEELEQGLHSSLRLPVSAIEKVKPDPIDFTNDILSRMDWVNGGFVGAPKFPMPVILQYLLAEGHLRNNPQAIQSVMLTLDRMSRSGIYDQVGGGFARYAVDEQWHIPHFEKMLYDNALIIQLYAQAFKYNQNPEYARIIRESLDFVFGQMKGDGYFYSSIDADSQGEEGAYYHWKWSDLQAALPEPSTLKLATSYYGAIPTGNWELGKNVLQAPLSLKPLEQKFGLDSLAILTTMTEVRTKLKAIRSSREAPSVDVKAITAWNALMITAISECAQALDDPGYTQTAVTTGDFIWQNLYSEKQGLYRIYIQGVHQGAAQLEDYAYLIRAFISLYELTFQKLWLDRADRLVREVLEHFADSNNPLFYGTGNMQDQLIVRAMPWSDEILPAPNAIMAQNLFILGSMLDRPDYLDRADRMAKAVYPQIAKTSDPFAYISWMALDWYLSGEPHEVAIVGGQADQVRVQLQKHFLPYDHFMGSDREENLALLKEKYRPDQTWIYVCEQGLCKRPVQDVLAALNLLHGN